MNDCMNVEVRDALPDFLHGRLGALDTARMKAHIDSCADCRSELALLREARAAAALVPPLDLRRIAGAIPAYGGIAAATASVPRPSTRMSSRIWKFAAALVLVAGGGWIALTQRNESVSDLPRTAVVTPSATGTGTTPEPSSSVAAVPAPEAPSRGTARVAEVQVASLSLLGSTADISDSDLEQLVEDLNAIDAMPAAEPTSITLAVEDVESTNEE